MGKRIFRLSAIEALSKTDFLSCKDLSIVLNDGRVFRGLLIKTDEDTFYCENKLKNNFQIKITDIKEVIYDTVSNI